MLSATDMGIKKAGGIKELAWQLQAEAA